MPPNALAFRLLSLATAAAGELANPEQKLLAGSHLDQLTGKSGGPPADARLVL